MIQQKSKFSRDTMREAKHAGLHRMTGHASHCAGVKRYIRVWARLQHEREVKRWARGMRGCW